MPRDVTEHLPAEKKEILRDQERAPPPNECFFRARPTPHRTISPARQRCSPRDARSRKSRESAGSLANGGAARPARAAPRSHRAASPPRPADRPASRRSPAATGNHGMKPRLCSSQYSSVSSLLRLPMLYSFCTLTIGRILRASSISSSVTSDKPTWRILPACCKSASAPSVSSAGTFGIDPMQLIQIDALHPQPPQAHLHALPDIFGAADRHPLARARPGEAALGRDHEPFG